MSLPENKEGASISPVCYSTKESGVRSCVGRGDKGRWSSRERGSRGRLISTTKGEDGGRSACVTWPVEVLRGPGRSEAVTLVYCVNSKRSEAFRFRSGISDFKTLLERRTDTRAALKRQEIKMNYEC